jgi:hypothetical protein
MRNWLPIFTAAQDAPELVLVPRQRYLTSACCSDPEHAPNRKEEGFKQSIRDFLFSSGIRNLQVVFLLWTMAAPESRDEELEAKN